MSKPSFVFAAREPEEFQFGVGLLRFGEGGGNGLLRIVHGAAHAAHPGKEFGMVQPDGQGLSAAHRESDDGALVGVLAHAIGGLDEG